MDNPQHSLDDALVEKVARAIARASIEAAEPQTGRLSDGGINQLVEYFSVRCYPEARAALEAAGVAELRGEIEELKKQRLMILAAVYGEAPTFVARICDESLDRSGALLGQVRDCARAALTNQEKAQG